MLVRPKAKPGRGGLNPEVIFDAVKESWEELQDALDALGDEEQQAVKDYFNSLIEDQDDLGDILFGDDNSDFEARVNMLDDNSA